MIVVSFGDLVAYRPFMMVFQSFDICRRLDSVLSNIGSGLATITQRKESSVQSHILHSVLLHHPHVLLRGSNLIQIEVCTFAISHYC